MDDRNGLPGDENSIDSMEDSNLAGSDTGTSQFFGTAKDVVARYTHCGFCGANLHFSHVTDFHRNLTQETAKCPECGTRAHQVIHKLQ